MSTDEFCIRDGVVAVKKGAVIPEGERIMRGWLFKNYSVPRQATRFAFLLGENTKQGETKKRIKTRTIWSRNFLH